MPKLLAETAREVDGIVATVQASGRVPSLVAGVVRQGSVVHVAGAGELPRPDPDLQYRIGSITKTMTAVLLLALRDEGRLSLDDPVRRYLTGAATGDVTVRQLLAHVSGVHREPDGPWWERAPGVDLDTLVAGLGTEPVAEAADRYHYSNLGYGVLGAVAERITGQPWAHLLAKRLLEPLGLDRTTYHATEPFARGYVVHPWHGTLREEPRHDAGAMAPAGQLWSTVHDLAGWAAFLADPAANVLRPETLAQMCVPVAIIDPDGWTGGYGLGLRLWRRGERIYVGHTGSMPGYLAVLVVHRPSGTGVVAFANTYALHGSTIADLGLDLLDAVLDREPPTVAPWRPGCRSAAGRRAVHRSLVVDGGRVRGDVGRHRPGTGDVRVERAAAGTVAVRADRIRPLALPDRYQQGRGHDRAARPQRRGHRAGDRRRPVHPGSLALAVMPTARVPRSRSRSGAPPR